MGGGGGGGIAGYTYSAALMMGLCNGPILGVGSIWSNKDRQALADLGMSFALGTIPQDPWGYVETKHPDEAVNYPGLAWIAAPSLYLGRDSAELPNLSFEVYGRGMQKTIIDAGGVPVWVDRTGEFYFQQAYDDYGTPLPLWYLNYTGDSVVGLYARITFSGAAGTTVDINAAGAPFSIASGGSFDISAQAVTQFTVSNPTSLTVTAIEIATSLSPEIAFFQSFIAGKYDVDPSEIISDFLTNPLDGAGLDPSFLGDLTSYSDYCRAANLLLSLAVNEQKPASEYLKEILLATNSEVIPSQGVLKIVPYGDLPLSGNGSTFTPDMTPQYTFTDDHFLVDKGEDPVLGTRATSVDAFNHVQVEFLNRAKDYNVEIAEAKDQGDIETEIAGKKKGVRTKDTVQLHCICDADVARQVAQLILQRELYIRNTYVFKVSWNYCLLEPMDIVAITDPSLGLFAAPCRITQIDEDDSDRLEITVEELVPGIGTADSYSAQSGTGFIGDTSAAPGNASAPIIFEPPEAICAAPDRPEVWIAASGGADWGGCEVWISTNGETYASIGFLSGKSKVGDLVLALPSGSNPDTTNRILVDMAAGSAPLLPGTLADAQTFQTLCYVDGELISYRDASLVMANRYWLGYLVRGAYGTPITAHTSGKPFARLDRQVLHFAYPAALIGKTVKIKLTSFNLYGRAQQSLADVSSYDFALTGQGLTIKPHTEGGANVSVPAAGGLTVTYATAFTNTPTLSPSIVGASAGFFVDITAQATTGFTLFVRNGSGTAVDATINWFSQGV